MQLRQRTKVSETIWQFAVLGLAGCLLGVTRLGAQVQTATIEGFVTDPSGAAVPDAAVQVINEGTQQIISTVSNENGRYQAIELPVGVYAVAVEAAGFKKSTTPGVVVHSGSHNRVDFRLELGEKTDTVTVTGAATLADTRTAEVGATITSQQIQNLPLNGRDPGQLINLVPGNNSYAQVNWWGFPTSFVTSGGSYFQNRGTDWMLDGGLHTWTYVNSAAVLPNPDALEEFHVVSSQRSAEYGRMNTAHVNAVIKSGTNELHGSAWNFHRNAALNAYNWGQTGPKSKLVQNQFGFTAGGPAVRDKLFYFGSYQGYREVGQSFTYATVVPTALERQGDFSQSAVRPINPENGLRYPGDRVPIDSVSGKILEWVPSPNREGNLWSGTSPNTTSFNEYLGKVDYLLTANHRLAGSLFYFQNDYLGNQGSNIYVPNITDYSSAGREYQVNVSHTWSISPNMLNVLRGVYLSIGADRGWLTPEAQAANLQALGSNFTQGFDPHPPNLTVQGYFNIAATNDGSVHSRNQQFSDTLRWTLGHHQLSLGGEVLRYHDKEFASPGPWTHFYGSYTGNALADFMTGIVSSFQYGVPDTETNVKAHFLHSAFVQDDWKVSRRLTLNLGFRWEWLTGITNPDDFRTTFKPYQRSEIFPNFVAGWLFKDPFTGKTDPGWTRAGYDAPQAFQPRFGFAYDVFGNGKTAVRGGFGIYSGEVHSISWGGGSPFGVPSPSCYTGNQAHVPISNPYVHTCDPIVAAQGWSGPPPDYTNPVPYFGAGIDPDTKRPYSYNFSFGVQHQITPSTLLDVAYVGVLTRHVWFNYDYFGGARYAPGADQSPESLASRYPYSTGQVAQVWAQGTKANASYNSLQIKFNRRLSRGLQFSNSYTWSKALDSNHWPVQDFADMRSQWGLSDGDIASVWVSSFAYSPQPNFKNRFTNAIARGWQLTGILTFRSGIPFTIFTGTDNLVNGFYGSRPNQLRDPYLSPNRPRNEVVEKWFETSAFVDPGVGQHGSLGVNTLRGPGSKNLDASLLRDFKITERFRFRIHFDVFNAFNWVNLLYYPDNYLSSPTFGKTIYGADTMRRLQFGGKLFF